jgi:hypothetical protein
MLPNPSSCSHARCWRASALALLVLAGCGGGGGDAIGCARVDGTWDVRLDYGDGALGTQRWQISQDACVLALQGDPPDDYGPALSSAVGNAGPSGFSATWANTSGACRTTSRLEAEVDGDAMSGTIGWSRASYGAGYCTSGGIGTVQVSGARR